MTALFLSAVLLLSAPGAAQERDPKAISSYAFDASRPAERRIQKIPDWLLARWREADEHPDYEDYAPTWSQRRAFRRALRGLPPRLKEALDERLIAFYFVKHLQGNGITDSGILYTLTHESAHAFDYIRGLTPHVDEALREALHRLGPNSWDAWRSYGVPLPADDFPGRAGLTFYGFGGGPKLDAAQAPAVCAQLAASPFASLYGSRSWAEDAAELFVARHLTQDLGLPYRTTCGGKVREPMSDPRVRERAERLLAPMYAKRP